MPVRSLNRFDFHDLGAESTEVAGEIRTCPERGEVENLHVRERHGWIRAARRTGPANPPQSQRYGVKHQDEARAAVAIRVSSTGGTERRPAERPVVVPAIYEEPTVEVLRALERRRAVVDGGGRNAHRLAQFDDVGYGSL